MSNYSIGLSGLDAAQKALDIIGNNIANAATEGYHLQRINLTPAYSSQQGPVLLGGGVNIASVTRIIDNLLEQEILRQRSLSEHISQEFNTLRTVETAFGELSAGSGLNAAIDEFYNALAELSAHPTDIIWQNNAVTTAEALAGRFRELGQLLTTLESQIRLEAENTLETINTLIKQIAELNDNIERIELGGAQANNLRDQRDQCITELSKLVGIEIQNREYGVVDVNIGGIPLVIGASATELEVGLQENGQLGITIAGAYNVNSDVQGGRLGGLLSLKNELLSTIHADLDSLATAIIQQINQYHVQGVGTGGSFTELTGWANASENLSDFSTISAGYVYIRVTNISSEEVTRTAIPVLQDDSSDTLSEIASFINGAGVANVSATVNSSNQLTVSADTGYKFDFLPGVISEPTSSNLNGDAGTSIPTVTISGIYTGTENQTFTCTVLDDGQIGNGTLRVKVEIGTDFVKEVNLGQGYAAGDFVDIGYGVKVRFDLDSATGQGILNKDEVFTIEALANSDTSGLLAAVGINTFFSGSSAADIAVCSDISATPARIATALGASMTDNTNVLRMAEMKNQPISSLNTMTPGEFYRQLVTDIGQQLYIKQMRQDNIEGIVQNLISQQNDISGIDINEQAAQLLVYEQMFQAMAKYINTIQSSVSEIMEMI